jgi:hypothetical protein
MMMNTLFKRTSLLAAKPAQRGFASALHGRMEHVIAERQKEVIAFRKEHANTVVDEVTVS